MAKIVAVASGGGHWVELLRLKPLLDEHDVTFISTNRAFYTTVPGKKYFSVPDGSRWNKFKLISTAFEIARVLWKIRPDIIISTGAAPGAVALAVGKLMGARTVWIESICHVEKISMSGKYVSGFCDRMYTQWPHLEGGKFLYTGNVML